MIRRCVYFLTCFPNLVDAAFSAFFSIACWTGGVCVTEETGLCSKPGWIIWKLSGQKQNCVFALTQNRPRHFPSVCVLQLARFAFYLALLRNADRGSVVARSIKLFGQTEPRLTPFPKLTGFDSEQITHLCCGLTGCCAVSTGKHRRFGGL